MSTSVNTTSATAASTKTQSTESRAVAPSRRVRRGLRAVVALATASAALLSGVSAANAYSTGTGGQQVDTTTYCDYGSRQMTVEANATQMLSQSAYAQGQWVRYRIMTRNVTNGIGTWVEGATWSRWIWVDADYYVGEVRIISKKHLGNTTLYGAARGNRYEVLVQYDHWVGTSAVMNDWSRYIMNYYGTRMEPSACSF